jgi:hypothetical protein
MPRTQTKPECPNIHPHLEIYNLGMKMNHQFLASSAITKTDAVVEPEFETFSDENRTVVESEDSEAGHPTELRDMDVEAGYERFGVAEMQGIYEEEVETVISSEEEGQSDWSLEECQELLDEVTAEKTRVHGSVEESGEQMEDAIQETISIFPPDSTENFANDSAMEIGTRKTASIDLPEKETSEDGVGATNLPTCQTEVEFLQL